jgi:L-lactate dehydrogenase complex protein LldG
MTSTSKSSRDAILGRLRAAQRTPFTHPNPRAGNPAAAHNAWAARQPASGDLVTRFCDAQQTVGSRVVRVPNWQALPGAIAPWIAEFGIRTAITGREPRLDALRRHLESLGVGVGRYEHPIEDQKIELFNTDLGITTSEGAVAETGSIVLIPSPEEPRLLSLAVPIHLAVVEAARIVPTMADFIRSGTYQQKMPTNLVFVSAASRTADIELVLAMGVHGPKTLLVAVIG